MCNITLKTNNSIDYTTISNDFLDNYMPEANGEYVKIYLYLLRCIPQLNNMELSVSSIADKFKLCTENDITRALEYWSSKGLLNLERNEHNEINEISFNIGKVTSVKPVEEPKVQAEAVNTSVSKAPQSTSNAPEYIKYSAMQINAFNQDEAFSELKYTIEFHLGTLTKTQLNDLMYFYDELKMPADLLEYLYEYCIDSKCTTAKYIRAVALNWHENSLIRRSDAVRYVKNGHIFKIRTALGLKVPGSATPAEFGKYDTWRNTYGFSMDMILKACEATKDKDSQPGFDHLDATLADWYKKGILTEEQLKELPATSTTARKTARNTRVGEPKKRAYNTKELERTLLNFN